MSEFSSEAKKAGLQEPEKPVPEMTEKMQSSSSPKKELTLLKEQLKMQELMSNGKKEDTDKSIFKD